MTRFAEVPASLVLLAVRLAGPPDASPDTRMATYMTLRPWTIAATDWDVETQIREALHVVESRAVIEYLTELKRRERGGGSGDHH